MKQLLFLTLLISQLFSSPAKAQEVVGKLEGTFGVDDLGAAFYSLPIRLPAGVNGLTPDLSLTYHSRREAGGLGVGFSLGGLSAITRCGGETDDDRKITTRFEDTDRFCLDGIPLKVASGQAYHEPNAAYRSESENFDYVRSVGQNGHGPESFIVRKKSGHIYEYGSSEASRLEHTRGVISWSLSRISDPNGNSIFYSYEKDGDDQELLLHSISYTSHEQASAPFRVDLVYHDHPISKTRYVHGHKLLVSKYLAAIEVRHHETLVWRYDIEYNSNPLNQEIFVEKIRLCHADGSCLKPLTFEWQKQDLMGAIGRREALSSAFNSQGGLRASARHIIDLNADGYADLVELSSLGVRVSYGGPSGFSRAETLLRQDFRVGSNWNTDHHIIQFQDMNRDGYPDLVGFHNEGIKVSYGSADGFAPAVLLLDAFGYHDRWRVKDHVRELVDLNQDGFLDVVGINYEGVYVSINHEGTLSEPQLWSTDFSHSEGWRWDFDDVAFVDINGDGLLDLVGRSGKRLSIALNTGTSFAPATHSFPDILRIFARPYHFFGLADMNGDGLADLIVMDGDGIKVALGDGVGFADYQIWSRDFTQGWSQSRHFRRLVDINQDGLLDVVGAVGNIFRVAINTGSGFQPERQLAYAFDPSEVEFFFEDINGDGSIDLTAFDQQGLQATKNSIKKPRILGIVDGYGNRIDISYGTLSDPTIYSKGSSAAYPVVDYQGAMDIVSAVSVGDGIGGVKKLRYHYEGFQIHATKYGGLGFAKRSVYDDLTQSKTIYHYSQDYSLHQQGKPLRIESYGPGSSPGAYRLESIATNEYETVFYDDGERYFVTMTKSQSERFNPDGSLLSTSTITIKSDHCGNPAVSTTLVRDEFGWHRKTIETDFLRMADGHCTGKPTRKTTITEAHDGRSGETRPQLSETHNWRYDDSGQLQHMIAQLGSEEESWTSYQFDSRGLLVSQETSWPRWQREDGIDFEAIRSRVEYDEYGHAISKINALGHSEKSQYDPLWGTNLAKTDANGQTVRYLYNSLGQLQEIRFPDGSIEQTERFFCSIVHADCPDHAVYGVRISRSGEAPATGYFDSYDRMLRQQSMSLEGKPVFVDTYYNRFGLIAKQSNPYFAGEEIYWTENVYDKDLFLSRKVFANGTAESFSRDGFATTTTNAKGHSRIEVRNSVGQILEVIDALGQQIRYRYDSFGRKIAIENARGQIISHHYNHLGQLISLDDPDQGLIRYEYNRLGQRWKTHKANGWEHSVYYDKLGRETRVVDSTDGRVEARVFEYDTAANGLGLPSRIYLEDQSYHESYTYDQLSRISSVATRIGGETFTTARSYDEHGRLQNTSYPSGFEIAYHYNEHGFKNRITDGRTVFWEATETNAANLLARFVYGNGVVTEQRYDPAMYHLQELSANNRSGSSIQHFTYLHDELGNLIQRTNRRNMQAEVFSYDDLNRLSHYTRDFAGAVSVNYDELGNIISKSDVGSYSYAETCNGVRAGPHAVTSISGNKSASYCYDQAGYMVSGAGRSITYSPIGKPSRIRSQAASIEFYYDALGRKFRRVDESNGKASETIYIGDLYEKVTQDGVIKHRHYIDGIAIHTIEESKQETIYLHHDHLGSLTAISDSLGRLQESFSYDPWGKRTDPEEGDLFAAATWLGFTSHEHLDSVGLIHMKGRVYDPLIGRFLSADPFIQDPLNAQNLNRYSYVLNNPLNAIDPSGYLFRGFSKGVRNFFKKPLKEAFRIASLNYLGGNPTTKQQFDKAGRWINRNENTLIAIGITVASFYIPVAPGLMLGQTFWGAAAVGGVSGYISSGGDLRAAAIGAIGGAAFHGIGSYINNGAAKVVAHGVVGGVRSVAMGGNFENGFAIGAVSQALAVSEVYSKLPDAAWVQGGAAMVVGGVTAEITGGSFEDGAILAVYSHMLNDVAHMGSPKVTRVVMWLNKNGASGLGHVGMEVQFDDGTSMFYEKFPEEGSLIYTKNSDIRDFEAVPTEEFETRLKRGAIDDRHGNGNWVSIEVDTTNPIATWQYLKDPTRQLEPYNLFTNNCLDYVRNAVRAGGGLTPAGIVPKSVFQGWGQPYILHY